MLHMNAEHYQINVECIWKRDPIWECLKSSLGFAKMSPFSFDLLINIHEYKKIYQAVVDSRKEKLSTWFCCRGIKITFGDIGTRQKPKFHFFF